MPIFTKQDIPMLNCGPVDSIRTIKFQRDKQKQTTNFNSAQKNYPYNNNTNYNIISNNTGIQLSA